MKTIEVVNVYKVINDAKLTKMDGKDKFLVIKAMRSLKKVALEFQDLSNDLKEKMKDDKFEEMTSKANKWAEEGGGEESSFSIEERKEINAYFMRYQNLVNDCLKTEGDKEAILDEYERLSQEAFEKFIESNDFKVDQLMMLEEVLCQE